MFRKLKVQETSSASFTDVFLPSKTSPKVHRENSKCESTSSAERVDSDDLYLKNLESRSTPSVSADSDSGIGSATEEVVPPKRLGRRAPGCLNLEELFARVPASPKSSKDYQLRMVKEIRIEDGSVGFGYETLFADGLNEQLRVVYVDDPYICKESQVCNFVVFCEILVARAPNLTKIILRTRTVNRELQRACFIDLRNSLLDRNIQLIVQRSDTIHDREIRFDNGWTYRIGRGLDYFQKHHGFNLGLTNYNFRRCLETVVCITKEVR